MYGQSMIIVSVQFSYLYAIHTIYTTDSLSTVNFFTFI